MGNPALSAIEFILGTVLNLYAMIMALRFVMQTVRADYYNPLAQFVVNATDPLVKPSRRVIPSIGRYDTASLLLCFGVLLLKLIIFKVMGLNVVSAFGVAFPVAAASIIALVLAALVDVIYLLFNIFIFSMFIQALLSWIPSSGPNPVATLLDSITRPVLAPVRRIVPPMGGLDLSVMVAIIGLYAIRILVIGTLSNLLF